MDVPSFRDTKLLKAHTSAERHIEADVKTLFEAFQRERRAAADAAYEPFTAFKAAWPHVKAA